jgi:hypothetical protein
VTCRLEPGAQEILDELIDYRELPQPRKQQLRNLVVEANRGSGDLEVTLDEAKALSNAMHVSASK